MAGAPERRAVDPPRREAERVELRAQRVAHLPHAREVHRPAVHVHDPLEQRQRLGVVRVDRANDLLLGGGEGLGDCRDGREERTEKEQVGDAHGG